jgi:hypothetical protein
LLEPLPEASFRRRKAAASCRTPKPAEVGSRFADNFNAFDQTQRPDEVDIQVTAGMF